MLWNGNIPYFTPARIAEEEGSEEPPPPPEPYPPTDLASLTDVALAPGVSDPRPLTWNGVEWVNGVDRQLGLSPTTSPMERTMTAARLIYMNRFCIRNPCTHGFTVSFWMRLTDLPSANSTITIAGIAPLRTWAVEGAVVQYRIRVAYGSDKRFEGGRIQYTTTTNLDANWNNGSVWNGAPLNGTDFFIAATFDRQAAGTYSRMYGKHPSSGVIQAPLALHTGVEGLTEPFNCMWAGIGGALNNRYYLLTGNYHTNVKLKNFCIHRKVMVAADLVALVSSDTYDTAQTRDVDNLIFRAEEQNTVAWDGFPIF